MAHFAGRREIGVKSPMRAASVDPDKNTTHAHDYTKMNIEFVAKNVSGADRLKQDLCLFLVWKIVEMAQSKDTYETFIV